MHSRAPAGRRWAPVIHGSRAAAVNHEPGLPGRCCLCRPRALCFGLCAALQRPPGLSSSPRECSRHPRNPGSARGAHAGESILTAACVFPGHLLYHSRERGQGGLGTILIETWPECSAAERVFFQKTKLKEKENISICLYL